MTVIPPPSLNAPKPCISKEKIPCVSSTSIIAAVTLIASVIIFSGALTAGTNYIVGFSVLGFDLLAFTAYIITVCVKNHKKKQILGQSKSDSNGEIPPYSKSSKQTWASKGDVLYLRPEDLKFDSSEEEISVRPKPTIPTYFVDIEEGEDLSSSDTNWSEQSFYSCEEGDSELFEQAAQLITSKSSEQKKKATNTSPPPVPKLPARERLAKEVIPALFNSLIQFIEKAVKIDSIKSGESFYDRKKKIENLRKAAGQFLSHFANFASKPRLRNPGKPTQIVRRMLAAWNTGQYKKLDPLFHEFNMATGASSSKQIPPKSFETEEDIKDFLKKGLFHVSFILEDVTNLLTPSSPDKESMITACVYFLLQETKDLSNLSMKELETYKELLKRQAEINQKKIWSRWRVSNSLEYMIMRNPTSETQTTYNKILECISKVTGKKTGDYSRLLTKEEKKDFTVIYCTLGTPGVWVLKRWENSLIFKTASSVLAKLAPLFKGKLASLIKKALEKEQVIQNGDTSLDEAISHFMDAVLNPFLHIFMQEYNMDTLTIPFINQLKEKVKELVGLIETEEVDTIVEKISETLTQVATDYEHVCLK